MLGIHTYVFHALAAHHDRVNHDRQPAVPNALAPPDPEPEPARRAESVGSTTQYSAGMHPDTHHSGADSGHVSRHSANAVHSGHEQTRSGSVNPTDSGHHATHQNYNRALHHDNNPSQQLTHANLTLMAGPPSSREHVHGDNRSVTSEISTLSSNAELRRARQRRFYAQNRDQDLDSATSVNRFINVSQETMNSIIAGESEEVKSLAAILVSDFKVNLEGICKEVPHINEHLYKLQEALSSCKKHAHLRVIFDDTPETSGESFKDVGQIRATLLSWNYHPRREEYYLALLSVILVASVCLLKNGLALPCNYRFLPQFRTFVTVLRQVLEDRNSIRHQDDRPHAYLSELTLVNVSESEGGYNPYQSIVHKVLKMEKRLKDLEDRERLR